MGSGSAVTAGANAAAAENLAQQPLAALDALKAEKEGAFSSAEAPTAAEAVVPVHSLPQPAMELAGLAAAVQVELVQAAATRRYAYLSCSNLAGCGPPAAWRRQPPQQAAPPGRQPPQQAAPPGRQQLQVVAAKKGGKKGGGSGKKGAGSLTDPPKPAEPYLQTPVIMQNLLLVESHFRKTGRPIFDREIEISDVAWELWEAPFAVLAHDIEEGEPDRFCYGNKAALQLFECTWDELIGTESTQSAEDAPEVQEERATALAQALQAGHIDNYSGWRKSFKGTRFQISGATLFNVEAPSGLLVGQAVTIPEWRYEDGTKGGENVSAAEAAAGTSPPNEGQVAAAEAAVVDQGALVRSLKEDQGLGNGSEEVQVAVAKLLELKRQLAVLQEVAAATAQALAAEAES